VMMNGWNPNAGKEKREAKWASEMIPTALSPGDFRVLERLAKGGVVLEVGALLGASTIKLAQVARRVISIDPHEGYPKDNPRPTAQQFLDNLTSYDVRDKVTVIMEPLEKVVGIFSDRCFDFIFIDITGEYRDTIRALESLNKTLGYWGVIAVHDMGNPDWPGAQQAVQDFAKDRDCEFYIDHGMGVVVNRVRY